jgi:hypothetical protein
MRLIDQSLLDEYLVKDATSQQLTLLSNSQDEELLCQKWLRQNQAKRAVWQKLYGDLMFNKEAKTILDVGGGITSLSIHLGVKHKYTLADILAHDSSQYQDAINRVGRNFIYSKDWISISPSNYDLIIANDIFPNVDQRLDLFLQFALPQTKKLRLSLTFYEKPRFYLTKRIDAEEILCMLTWNSEILKLCLKKYLVNIIDANFSIFGNQPQSLFENGRQICILEMHGNL